MSNLYPMLQECGTLNRVFAAFFMNECWLKDGINIGDHIPRAPQIYQFIEKDHFFTEKDSPPGLKHFFHGRVNIEDVDLEKFRSAGIYNFFDDEIKDQITDVARIFSDAVKSHKHCDLVFSCLPDAPPFIYDCILDPETNFRSRLIIGHNLASNKYSAIWEFYCLLMVKLRETGEHPIYGKIYKDVDSMTDEERELYNKQPESE